MATTRRASSGYRRTELAERLNVVERQFDQAVELHGYTGAAAREILATGKVGTLERVETDAAFAGPDGAIKVSSLEVVGPLAPESVNLVVSPLSLHLTNDTPGVFIQIRRALKPDGLLLAAIPGSGTLQELREVLLATEAEMSGGASPRVIPLPMCATWAGSCSGRGFTCRWPIRRITPSATARCFRCSRI